MLNAIYKKQGRRYVPAPELEHLTHFDPHTLLIGATRYYTGRMTIAACCFAEYELAKAWPHIPANTRAIIARDLEEEFRRDNEARIEGTPYLPLGMDCDRRAWDAVRLAYAGDAPPMPEREPLPAVNLARRLRALAAQMDELAGDVMALDEGHWAYGQDLSDWAGIVDEWAAGLAAKDKT